MLALRALARRHQQLSVEIDELDALIGPLVTAINPTLIGLSGVGADVAGQLLVTAGDNPQRLTQRGGVRDLARNWADLSGRTDGVGSRGRGAGA